jgi:hypothetical protein
VGVGVSNLGVAVGVTGADVAGAVNVCSGEGVCRQPATRSSTTIPSTNAPNLTARLFATQ